MGLKQYLTLIIRSRRDKHKCDGIPTVHEVWAMDLVKPVILNVGPQKRYRYNERPIFACKECGKKTMFVYWSGEVDEQKAAWDEEDARRKFRSRQTGIPEDPVERMNIVYLKSSGPSGYFD